MGCHILQDCKHSIADPDTMVSNYPAFDANRKSHIPDKYYLAVKNIVKGTLEHQLAQEGKETRQPKMITWGFVDMLKHIMNKGNLTLLNPPRMRTSTNPHAITERIQSDLSDAIANLGFLQLRWR